MGACSSLIKMHHQISTGSQTLNEASNPGTVVGHSATHPARWKDKILRGGSTWKQEPRGVGYFKPLWCRNNVRTPHLQLASGWWAPWLQLLLRQLPKLQTLLCRASGELCEKNKKQKKNTSEPEYPECTPLHNSKHTHFTAVKQFRENAVFYETENKSGCVSN